MFDSELRRQADAGSAEHQWQLSLAYRERKQAGRAGRYFRRALEQGHPAAVCQQLEEWTRVVGEHANFAAARALLERHPLLEGMESWRWRLQLNAGLLSAREEALATWELLGLNYPDALRYAALRCAMVGRDSLALSLLNRAADTGDELARRVLNADLPGMAALAAGNDDKELSLQDLQDVFEDTPSKPRSELASEPLVYVSRSWAPPLVCRLLALLAEPELQPSLTYEPGTGRQVESPLRTSYSMIFMPWLVDPSIAYIQRRLAQFCGMQPFQCEVLGLLRYEPGQAYQLHYDAFGEDQSNIDHLLQDGGQRIRTALVYLSEDYSGGETRFEYLDMNVRGKAGDLLVFNNVDSRGIRHRDSLHTGMPVKTGTKWLLSQWYREHETAYTRQMDWREGKAR